MPKPFIMFGSLNLRTSIPPELADYSTFLGYLCLSQAELKKIWWFRKKMYKDFKITSKYGKTRRINAPDRRLKMLQRNISPLLDKLYSPRNPVHGFIHERSVMTNASSHLSNKFVVKLDIENFFPSISENRVAGLLHALGVDESVSAIIARLCTNRGVLPQGAPTSPVLSNMICFRLDKELLKLAKTARCIYTRYADDVTFSSYQKPELLFEVGAPQPGRFSPELLASNISAAFTNNGFKLNANKSQYADKNSRRVVTGLKINSGLNVDRRFVRNIRSALYSVETLGLSAAQKKFADQYGGKCDLTQHLKGKISWLGSVKGHSDPVFRATVLRFNSSFPSQPIKMNPSSDEIRNRGVWVLEHFHGDFAQGTAFFMKGVGLVTAAHCVADAIGEEIDVHHHTKPSNSFKVKVKRHHFIKDLAILEHAIPSNEYYELELTDQDLQVGDTVTAVGYPAFAPGDGLNVRSGQISSFSVKSTVPLVEVTQKLTQGMSGGPILDEKNRVIGIIHKGGPNEGRDFAVHVKALMEWLQE
ncbi:hypothetical protein BR10RB9215_C11029 [Brucella sp. 10RB9215]|uniref:trypsin-like peptidase domain-containing protein n=1 Tax=Brucella sp. 10RB9215 TaxID=1149953 RepID=UPI000909D3B0|nr:trypsin-like peptidase domain-containing protein [Brucella sp. 10RB9215]SBW14203.1 hypothetical protein BR10RB9215_C11029 [Brucella sp. 10RB9215]